MLDIEFLKIRMKKKKKIIENLYNYKNFDNEFLKNMMNLISISLNSFSIESF